AKARYGGKAYSALAMERQQRRGLRSFPKRLLYARFPPNPGFQAPQRGAVGPCHKKPLMVYITTIEPSRPGPWRPPSPPLAISDESGGSAAHVNRHDRGQSAVFGHRAP